MNTILSATVMVWYKSSKGEDLFSSFERVMNITDTAWAAQQYAEVNNGKCEIFDDGKKIAEYDAVEWK